MRPAPAVPEVAVVDLKVCDRCGLCLPLCPPEAIHLALIDLVVDRTTCTGCRKCISPCPVGRLWEGRPWAAGGRWGWAPGGPACGGSPTADGGSRCAALRARRPAGRGS